MAGEIVKIPKELVKIHTEVFMTEGILFLHEIPILYQDIVTLKERVSGAKYIPIGKTVFKISVALYNITMMDADNQRLVDKSFEN